MKKILFTMVFFVFVMVLVGCDQTKPNYENMINHELFIFESEVSSNLELPQTKTVEGVTFNIQWRSSHPSIISNSGVFLGATEHDVIVTLTATVSLDTFEKALEYEVTVKAIEKVTVTFDSDGGTVVSSLQINKGQTISEPTDPIKAEHNFLGWYLGEILFDFNQPITSNLTLKARWANIETYTVTFLNQDDSVLKEVNVQAGNKVSAEIPQDIIGYSFTAWVKSDMSVFDFELETIQVNITLKASYDLIVYNIIYNVDSEASLSETGASSYTILGEANLKTATFGSKAFIGWFLDEDFTTKVEEIAAGQIGDLTLYAKFEVLPEGTLIYTSADLLSLIQNGATENVFLMNDIDMSGVTLVGSSRNFSYVFDGQGYTIRNVDVLGTSNKLGFLFREVEATGVVKNVTFADSIHRGGGNSESSAFVAAFAQAGATFMNINFYNVSVIHAGSYAALLFGDVINDGNGEPISVMNITVINDGSSYIEGSSYVGGLIGAARKAVTINVENIYFDSKVVATNQAAGAIMGRFNSANIFLNVTQAVIKGEVMSTKNVGAVLGTSVSGSTLNIDQIFVSNMIQRSGNTTVNLGAGNKPSGSITNQSNVFYASSTVTFFAGDNNQNISDGTPLSDSEITELWFTSSDFNQTFFSYRDNDLVRNSAGADVIETGFSIQTSEVNKYYMINDMLDLTGLKVFKTFSDGSSVLLDEALYEINTVLFDNSQTGSYEIIVNYQGESKSFFVDVVEIVGIGIDIIDLKQTYLVNQSLALNELYVEAILNDGKKIRLTNSDFTIDTSNVNMSEVGSYHIKVTYKIHESENIMIHVHQPYTVTSSEILIKVDQNYQGIDGEVEENHVNFKTVKSALQFLDNINPSASVVKKMYIKSGVYREKVTVKTPNLYMIGDSQNSTVIVYNAASGIVRPNGASFGTQGSATVSIKSSAYLFRAAHLTFMNDFDYNGATIADKQGVAMVNEADRALFVNVGFKGYQDTLYAKSGRQLYYNVYVEGVVDFIFGNGGPAYFTESTIKSLARSIGVISTNMGFNSSDANLIEYGYVFYKNTFIYEAGVPAGSVDLGRPWRKDAAIAYIENKFDSHISTRGWTEMSGNLPENARFYEYQNTNLSGSLLPTTTKGQTLTAAQRDLYIDTDVVFGLTNGAVSFNEIFDYSSDLDYLTNLLK